MKKNNLVSKSLMLLCGTFFLGCSQNQTISLYPKHKSLSQDRLFFIDKPFANSQLQAKRLGVFKGGILDVLAPQLVENMIDVVGKSMVEISGKNNQSITKSAKATDYFYQDASYKKSGYHMVFVSAEFGQEKEAWRPVNFDAELERSFQALNLVGQPRFYMEATIVPIADTQYMEIVPTYLFYNTHLNPKGMDQKRDLELRFSFSEIGSSETIFTDGTVILRDVKVGEEYGKQELAGIKTEYMLMPQISPSKQGKSGDYTLRVDVTETRDITEWLANLGEIVSQSKSNMAQKIYLTEEEKIIQETALKQAQIEVQKTQLALEELKTNGASQLEILTLKSQLLEKQAQANQLAVQYGKAKPY